jgi:hypothetical protein
MLSKGGVLDGTCSTIKVACATAKQMQNEKARVPRLFKFMKEKNELYFINAKSSGNAVDEVAKKR